MSDPCILIAEDNRVMADVARFNLERAGFHVVVAENGELALQAAQQQHFDLVISDYQMPKMCGEDLLKSLRELPEYSETPFFLCTAKGYELNLQKIRESIRVIEFVNKPFSPMAIVKLVKKHLQHQPVT